MPLFNYVALDKQGNEQFGTLEAEDKRDVNAQLRQLGLFGLEVTHDAETKVDAGVKGELSKLLAQVGIVSSNKKIFFFRQMALMLRSGLALTESLDMVANIMGGKIGLIVTDISNNIKSGGSFSDGIAQAGVFPSMSEHMIRSAEATGELDVVMGRVADDLGRKAEMKRQMMAAMLYPGITMLIAVFMGYFLVATVIPKFAKIFENSGKKLPPDTQRLIDISNFINAYGLFIILGVAAGFALLHYIRTKVKGRYITDQIVLMTPVFGKVVRVGAMSQIGWGLSMLLQSGLTLVEALKIVEKLIPNSVIALEIKKATDNVLIGRDLGSSLTSPYIDPLISQLASVGERTGGLVEIMFEAGCFYEEGLKALSKTMANLVEPASILLIGGMVMAVYIGFFKAMMGAST
ncbi:type II secretion system F family protein [Moritella sp. 36]|uniref:type II secretion system F family protein n=1 Tax=Moritella sp. 36 TaxID=2746233 RepID=UPI001BAAB1DA|nr:type II secretion system F family protein [Moritella sp. 36]QUM89180.1 type II secretion system F family protein [Moritella sp. 36]